MVVVEFMSGKVGRAVRALVGAALVVVGFVLGGGWLVLSVVGLVPLLAGVFGVCLIAPLVHRPLRVHPQGH